MFPSHRVLLLPSCVALQEVVKRAVAAGFAPTNFSQYLYQFQRCEGVLSGSALGPQLGGGCFFAARWCLTLW